MGTTFGTTSLVSEQIVGFSLNILFLIGASRKAGHSSSDFVGALCLDH
jgi:hypothetical protein